MEQQNRSTEKKFNNAALLVFFVGVILRATLSLINWEANDDHIAVIRVIADENRIPPKDEMDEAFQPKLYHIVVAQLWKAVPTQSLPIRIRIAQLVSCTAGILTLLLALQFIKNKSNVSAKVRFISFSLVALNPNLIGINAQATNDSFVILFVSLSLTFGYQFFESGRLNDFSWMAIYSILAGLSKGNGLIVFIAIMLTVAFAVVRGCIVRTMMRRQLLLYGTLLITAYFAVVPIFGPYWKHFRQYGSPFVINITPARMPNVLEKTSVYRPTKEGGAGVRSIADSLLTFRFIDMLKTPVITNDHDRYPQHRTSLWSQLYGRANFAHFDAWPPSWQLTHLRWHWAPPFVWNLGRLILLCALLPTTILVMAVWRRIFATIGSLIRSLHRPVRLADWLLEISVFGYLAFIIIYSLRYRDFSVMKAIFIFPGLVGFLSLFARECDRFYRWCTDKKLIRFSADLIFAFLCLLYTGNVIVLIAQLSAKLFLS